MYMYIFRKNCELMAPFDDNFDTAFTTNKRVL